MEESHLMPAEEVIRRVTEIAKKYHTKRLDLFGSYAMGTQTEKSDIDFVVYGCEDMQALLEEVEEIPTLRKIDIFNYDEACSEYLREDMDKYGKQIFESI